MTLLFASANKNKIEEIRSLMPLQHQLLGLGDVGIFEEIPEPGHTIIENSLLKTRFAFEVLKKKAVNYAVFADDSGLEVQALNHAPGVYSARYAGLPKNDLANNQKLLKEMSLVTNRKARFVTVITLMLADGSVNVFEGEVKGTIAHEAKGSTGFGYDPLFIPQGYRSTFAELGAEVKNAISHRGIAVRKLVDFLNTLQV